MAEHPTQGTGNISVVEHVLYRFYSATGQLL